MNQNATRPASAGTEGRGANTAPAKKLYQYNHARVGIPAMIVRILPDGEPVVVRGRAAQTLALLMEVGAKGFNAGEASPLRWARRTSAYVHQLRQLGFNITTDREAVGDASVARYRLQCWVEVLHWSGCGQ